MLVDPSFHAPAIWQAIMLMLAPLMIFAVFYKDARYIKVALLTYVVIGILLVVVLIKFVPSSV